MQKRIVIIYVLLVTGLFLNPCIGRCEVVPTQDIIKELEALKSRVNKLEQEVIKKDRALEKLMKKTKKIEDITADDRKARDTEGGVLDKIQERVSLSGLIEVGGAYQDVTLRGGGDVDSSDINLTTLEVGVEVDVNEWVNGAAVFLYEDETFGDEGNLDVDVGIVTFGNLDKSPFYLTVGKMYVPYGALLTHFSDSPLIDGPVTLSFGEISEKAVLVGFDRSGVSISGYVFNGEVDEGSDNKIGSFGFDINYTLPEEQALELFSGFSYINNIAEGGISEALPDSSVRDYVDGVAAYLHMGFRSLFFDAEYMTALDGFDSTELPGGPEPSVWNLEAGCNYDWGKNLEIVFKYAGSDETGALGFPEKRYGIGFNQEIFDNVTGSVGYFKDEYHSDDAHDGDSWDKRHVVFGQVAVEF